MIEDQHSISTWANKTFGYPTRQRSINRMMEEVIELGKIKQSDENNFNKVSDECADILITLYQVASVYGFDLHECVDPKMQINRNRKWKIAGDGTGQHIEE